MAPHLREEVCKIAREEKLQPVLPGEAFECGQVDEVLLTVIDRLIQAEAVPDTEGRCGVETFRRVARVESDLVSAVPEGEPASLPSGRLRASVKKRVSVLRRRCCKLMKNSLSALAK